MFGMQRGFTNLTPIYFFSSVRAGSGKSTIVSNLSVYLNNLSNKVAVIDFDYNSPDKLRSTFPPSIEIKDYDELSTLVSASDPRFQQNFYFTDTSKLSFFPAHKLKTPYELVNDTAFRDFFLQLSSTFDYVLINLAPGTKESASVSDLLSKSFLFRGCKPASLIVSLSDAQSLLSLDNFIQNNQTVSYQAEENTYFLFNKVPGPTDVLELDDTSLTSSDIRSIFTYPLTYIIPFIDEILEQKNKSVAYVLHNNTIINQHIVGLCRLLNGAASISYLMREVNNYQSCISGALLSKIYPYLEKLQKKVANKLFINPADVNIYLEQNDENFRIRIRLTSLGQKLLGIRSDIPDYHSVPIVKSEHPSKFEARSLRNSLRTVKQIDREATYTLSFKSIFTFDDSFYSNPVSKLNKNIPIIPAKEKYPSPIIFPQRHEISEIPTLTNILGLIGQKRNIIFSEYQDDANKQGVSQVYIPTEFPLAFNLEAKLRTRYNSNNRYLSLPPIIKSKIQLTPSYDYLFKKFEPYSIFDIFARNKKFEFISDFGLRKAYYGYNSEGLIQLPAGRFSLINDNLLSNKIAPIVPKEDTSKISSIAVANFKLNFDDYFSIDLATEWSSNTQKLKTESPKSYVQTVIDLAKPEYFSRQVSWNLHSKSPKFNIFANVEHSQILLSHNIYVETDRKTLETPKKYELNINKQAFKSGFLSKNFRPLPSSINLEDVMLEYCYRIQVKEDEPDFIFVEKRIKEEDYKPTFNMKFEHKYIEPDLLIRRRSTYLKPVMYQIFKLGKLKVSSKVIIKNVEYKVAYNEIFPVIFFPKAIEIPVTRQLRQPTWASESVKNMNELAPFKLKITPLKLLTDTSSPYNTQLPPVNHHYSKYFESDFDDLNVNILVSAPKKPAFAKDYLKYSELPLVGAEVIKRINLNDDLEITDDLELNIDSTFNSELAAPNIFTEKMRFRSDKFFSYDWNVPSADIITFKPEVSLKTPLKIQTMVHHNDDLEDRDLIGVVKPKYPILVKSLKLINNFTDLQSHKPEKYDFTFKLDESRFKLFICKDKNMNQDNSPVQKPFEQNYLSPKLVSRYILKKLAGKPPTPKLGRGKFFVIPEKASDILYKHLIWQSSREAGPVLCEFNSKIENDSKTISVNNFDVKYKFIPIPASVEFLPHEDVTLRLSRVFLRKPYRIQNNHIKDLLALAKAQSAKASELVNAQNVSGM